jgi:hypothetical protein
MRHAPAARLAHLVAGLLAVAAAAPSLGHGFVGPGLDPSWQDGVRAAVEQQRIFGRDIVFSYGPLGFLSTRVPPAGAAFSIVAIDLVMMAMTAWLAWTWRETRRGGLLTLLLAAALVSVRPFLSGMDLALSAAWLGMACVAAGSDAVDGRPRAPGLAVAGLALASLTFLVKANTGLVVPLVGAAWLAVRAGALGSRGLALAALATPAAVVTGLAAVLPVDVFGLASGTADVAAGYQDAMHLAITDPAVRRAWWTMSGVGVGLTGVVAWIWWRDRRLAVAATLGVSALLLFLTMKQGFVRADNGHAAMALRALPGLALVIAAATDAPRRNLALAAAVIVVALTWAAQKPLPFGDMRADATAAWVNAGNVLRAVRPAADLRHVPTLPAGLVAALSRGTVDVLSSDLILVTREPQLRWQPRPTLQGYVASTPGLDARNAAHWLGPAAPDALLVTATSTCVDDRCWVDEPGTRVAIWRRYVPLLRAGDLAVLGRRETPLALVTSPAESTPWAIDRPVALPVPRAGERLRLVLPVRTTWLAQWQRLVLRPPGLTLRLDGALGGRSIRVWPSLLTGGMLVSPVAGDLAGLVGEAAGDLSAHQHPSSARVSAADGWGYEAAGVATLTRLRLAKASLDAPPSLAEPATRVRHWRIPDACAAGHVDHWPDGTHDQVGGWAVVPGAERPADRVLFTAAPATLPLAAGLLLAEMRTLTWRADVFEVTRRGATLLSGFRSPAWFPAEARVSGRAVEAWAWDAVSGDAWQLCWAIPR